MIKYSPAHPSHPVVEELLLQLATALLHPPPQELDVPVPPFPAVTLGVVVPVSVH